MLPFPSGSRQFQNFGDSRVQTNSSEIWAPPVSLPANFEEILSDSNIDMREILKQPQLFQLFDEKEENITNKIVNSAAEIISIFVETNQKEEVSIIREILLSKNTALIEQLLDLPCFEYFISVLEGSNEFKIGICTFVILHLIDKWPEQIMQIFYQSNKFFPLILHMIDDTSIYLLVFCLIHIANDYSPAFIWGFFLCLMKGECGENPPETWDISPFCISACAELEITIEQRFLLYRSFFTYMQQFPDELEFREIVFKSLPILMNNAENDAERSEILNFAINFPTNPDFVAIALKLGKIRPMCTDITEKAISYLSMHVDITPIGEIILLFHLLFTEATPNNFVFRVAANLIEETLEKHRHSKLFLKAMQHMIAYSWNHPSHNEILYISFLIGYASILGSTSYLLEWNHFYHNVVNPFSRREYTKRDFRFDESKWNRDLINRINEGSTNFVEFYKIKKKKHYSLKLGHDTSSQIPSKSCLNFHEAERKSYPIPKMCKESKSFSQEFDTGNLENYKVHESRRRSSDTFQKSPDIDFNLPDSIKEHDNEKFSLIDNLRNVNNNLNSPPNTILARSVHPTQPRSDRLVIKMKPKSSTPQPYLQKASHSHKHKAKDSPLSYTDKKQKNCNVF